MAIGGGVPDLPNLIGTHHKTGTIWMHGTFLRFAEASGLRLSALSEKQIQQERTMPSPRSPLAISESYLRMVRGSALWMPQLISRTGRRSRYLDAAAMPPVHRMFFHYSEFPFSLRALFTATLITLGLGYVFATIQVYTVHAGLDGNPGINANDIAIAYGGNANSNRLQVALLGPMSGNAPSRERRAIIDWASDGADRAQYDKDIKPIVDNRCMRCHDGSAAGAPKFTTFEAFAEFAKPDTGMSLATLVRVSHIHLFGMTFIFFILGMIFSHAYVRPVWFKALVIAMPFIVMITDVGSWFLTKINPNFAWIIIGSGVVMALSFAFQWFVSMYQIWFYKFTAGNPDHTPQATAV